MGETVRQEAIALQGLSVWSLAQLVLRRIAAELECSLHPPAYLAHPAVSLVASGGDGHASGGRHLRKGLRRQRPRLAYRANRSGIP
jgi:hypothetical protein